MFSKFEHDSADNKDIALCAGPKERQALVKMLKLHTSAFDFENIIKELQASAQDQTYFINSINDILGKELLCEKDADISFDQHLSDMSQEDVNKVMKHLHIIFIDKCEHYTGIDALDNNSISSKERKDIYENVIIPWIGWVRSAKQNKPDTAERETNSVDNKSDNTDT